MDLGGFKSKLVCVSSACRLIIFARRRWFSFSINALSRFSQMEMKTYLKAVRCWQFIFSEVKLRASRQMLNICTNFHLLWHLEDNSWTVNVKCKENSSSVEISELSCRVSGSKYVNLVKKTSLDSQNRIFIKKIVDRSRSKWCKVEMCAVMMTIHQRLRQKRFIALVSSVIYWHSIAKTRNAVSLLISHVRLFIFLHTKSEQQREEEKFWALRDSNIPDISFHHFALAMIELHVSSQGLSINQAGERSLPILERPASCHHRLCSCSIFQFFKDSKFDGKIFAEVELRVAS